MLKMAVFAGLAILAAGCSSELAPQELLVQAPGPGSWAEFHYAGYAGINAASGQRVSFSAESMDLRGLDGLERTGTIHRFSTDAEARLGAGPFGLGNLTLVTTSHCGEPMWRATKAGEWFVDSSGGRSAVQPFNLSELPPFPFVSGIVQVPREAIPDLDDPAFIIYEDAYASLQAWLRPDGAVQVRWNEDAGTRGPSWAIHYGSSGVPERVVGGAFAPGSLSVVDGHWVPADPCPATPPAEQGPTISVGVRATLPKGPNTYISLASVVEASETAAGPAAIDYLAKHPEAFIWSWSHIQEEIRAFDRPTGELAENWLLVYASPTTADRLSVECGVIVRPVVAASGPDSCLATVDESNGPMSLEAVAMQPYERLQPLVRDFGGHPGCRHTYRIASDVVQLDLDCFDGGVSVVNLDATQGLLQSWRGNSFEETFLLTP